MAIRHFNFSKKGLIENITGQGRVTSATLAYDSTITSGIGTIHIDNNGELSGTYYSSVVCDGNASITGPVIVDGSLIVRGMLAGTGGHTLTVRGDLITLDEVNITPSMGSLAQGAITIQGDWIADQDIDIHSYGGTQAEVYVTGDLINDSDVSIYGGYGSPGGILYVYGDLLVDNLDLSGSPSDAVLELSATNGGILRAYGNICIDADIVINGGYADDVGFPGADAGTMYVQGSVYVDSDIFMNGGYGDLYGGQGGQIYINGGLYVDDEIEVKGGNSVNETGGNGGHIFVGMNLVHDDGDNEMTRLNGGSSTNAAGGSGGTIDVRGSTSMYGIVLNGGNGATANGPCGEGTFRAGIVAHEISMLDGAGLGTAPTDARVLRLGGHSALYELDVADRAQTFIRSHSDHPAIVKVTVLTSKDTFADYSYTPSGQITNPNEKILYTGTNGVWYAVSGSLV